MKISMVSEHASPLAALGGVDAGGRTSTWRRFRQLWQIAATRSLCTHAATTPVCPQRCRLVRDSRWFTWTPVPPDASPPRTISCLHGRAGRRHLRALGRPNPGRPARSLLDVRPRCHPSIQTSRRSRPPCSCGADLPRPRLRKTQAPSAADTSPPAREWLEPWVGRTADWVIATCPDEVFELKALGISRSKISIAPCGVDLTLFPGTSDAEPKSRTHRILSVGRLVQRKGVDLIIQALPPLLAEAGFTDVELLIVGGSGGHPDP